MSDPAAPSAQAVCPRCGTPHQADARFCPTCGYDFATPAPAHSGWTAPPPPRPTSRRRWILIGVAVIIGLAVIGSLGRDPDEPSAEATPSPRLTATATPRLTPKPASATPIVLPSVDPKLAFEVFKTTFETMFFAEMSDQVADAIEADFYWIDSVDRLAYDNPNHQVVIDATVAFESVYLNDPVEWHADTWSLYQAWSRDVWGSFVDGFESGGAEPVDWNTYTPALVLNGNAGRLRASCPGSLIYRVSERQATQTEYLAECSLTP